MVTRVSLWGPVLAAMALIFWLSAQPALPAVPGGFTDKEAHALVYGALAGLWYRASARGRWRGVTLARGVVAVVAATAYGVSDEWHQTFVATRTADAADVLADAIGAATAATTIWACGIMAARRQLRQADTSR